MQAARIQYWPHMIEGMCSTSSPLGGLFPAYRVAPPGVISEQLCSTLSIAYFEMEVCAAAATNHVGETGVKPPSPATNA